jgi:RNA polymerase sigma factor (sigma-70 family)
MGLSPAMSCPTLRAVQLDADSSRPRTGESPPGAAPPSPPPDLAAAYDRLGGVLFRFFYVRIGRDEHLAADLMQQLWAAAAKNASRVPESEIEYWLRGVARNLLNTHWRRISTRPTHVAMEDARTGASIAERMTRERLPAEEVEKREVQDRLLVAITTLGSSDQELIFAHYFEGAAQVDLAKRLGMSVRAIEGRLYRARQLLREALSEVE